jgi:hypothetical protein
MTRARTLKSMIRARAAKTGERYTTARRHIVSAGAVRAVAPAPVSAPAPAPAPAHAPAPAPGPMPPTPRATSKGGLSDTKAREKTGHGLEHWFATLDAFGAVERGHTAAARHLHDTHGVDGWYAQGITVAYERARGVRDVNQRCDGAYEVSASKVVTATTAEIIAAFTDTRRRARWTRAADPALARALKAALGAAASKGFVVRADHQGRYRYRWDDTIVQFYVLPKPGGKTSISVQHTKLPSSAMVDTRREHWRTALSALADLFAK